MSTGVAADNRSADGKVHVESTPDLGSLALPWWASGGAIHRCQLEGRMVLVFLTDQELMKVLRFSTAPAGTCLEVAARNLPPDCMVDRVFYCNERRGWGVALLHPTFERSAHGGLVPWWPSVGMLMLKKLKPGPIPGEAVRVEPDDVVALPGVSACDVAAAAGMVGTKRTTKVSLYGDQMTVLYGRVEPSYSPADGSGYAASMRVWHVSDGECDAWIVATSESDAISLHVESRGIDLATFIARDGTVATREIPWDERLSIMDTETDVTQTRMARDWAAGVKEPKKLASTL